MNSEEARRTLKERLNELIEMKGKPVPAQADEMGIPYQTFHKYVAGISACPAHNLVTMAQYYGVSMEYLLGLKTTGERFVAKSAIAHCMVDVITAFNKHLDALS